ncbi:hypothetical protein [Phytohabitans houttuyneae]|jgi:hypothetical protein|uniref:Uncharacterized protein n=1 Tax=Phytohabitans houttuyneae TaxID=1076126 RepID=A0A6V8KB52_9ACTN|nr:hypothetical protein [Phytohabitans houttuyneae]GFJ79681.1 hypothetical protein Phou_038610 [Phytohabitans houttuyneae]
MIKMLWTRIALLRGPGERDRGDSPVPTAIIIAGLAAAAGAVVLAASGLVDSFMGSIGSTP